MTTLGVRLPDRRLATPALAIRSPGSAWLSAHARFLWDWPAFGHPHVPNPALPHIILPNTPPHPMTPLQGFVTGILSPSVVVLRAELVGTLKWSPCCVWIDEVSLEGFVGVTAGSYDLSSSIGKWKIVENPW